MKTASCDSKDMMIFQDLRFHILGTDLVFSSVGVGFGRDLYQTLIAGGIISCKDAICICLKVPTGECGPERSASPMPPEASPFEHTLASHFCNQSSVWGVFFLAIDLIQLKISE